MDNVFFNESAKEFVTKHMIGGIRSKKLFPPVQCDVIVDNELFKERKSKDKIENIAIDGLIFFIKKDSWIKEFERVPKPTSALTFDEIQYQIESVADDMGALEITLIAARG